MKIFKSFAVGVALLGAGSASAFDSDLQDWSIEVRLYRTDPAPEFKALDELGAIVMQETAKGFVIRSVVTRDSFHPGATVCLLVDQRLGNANDEKARILEELSSIEPGSGAVSLTVSDNSPCMERN